MEKLRGRRGRKAIEDSFRSQATTAERVSGLIDLGIPPTDLARGLGVRSASTVRNWTTGGAEPRANTAIALDDLRLAAEILLDAGLPPKRVGVWLMSRNAQWLEGERPLDCIASTPMRVLSAAQETAIGMLDLLPGKELPRLRLVPSSEDQAGSKSS